MFFQVTTKYFLNVLHTAANIFITEKLHFLLKVKILLKKYKELSKY